MENFDINFILKLQEAIRLPFLDYLFSIFSFIGSEYFFLIATAILYWCVNKRFAYKFFNVFMVGQLFVGILKVTVKRARPFEQGATSITADTEGFSFPSGHSHNAANMSTQIITTAHNKTSGKNFAYILLLGVFVTLAVMFSRMYLGQHYLTDVLAGAVLGVFIALLFYELFELLKDKEHYLFLAVLPLSLMVLVICLAINQNPEGVVKLIGAYGAMALGYYLEKKHINYQVKSGKLYKQLIKILIGILLIVLLKEGIALLLKQAHPSGRIMILTDYMRYFLIGLGASYVLPVTFKRLRL